MLTPAAGRAHPPRVASTCSVAPRLLAALAAGLAISLGATAQNPTLEVGGPFARELPANSPILHEGRDGDRLVILRGIQFDFTPTASGNYTILVKSHFFDVGAMVALGEKDVASDDNGWLNTHSRVVARLTAGERYAVHVMTYENGGAFEITVRRGKVGAIADEDRDRLEIADLEEGLAVRRAAGVAGTDLLGLLENLARRKVEAGMGESAIPLFEEALQLRRAAHPSGPTREEALLRNEIGLELDALGRTEAVPMFEAAHAQLTLLTHGRDDADLAQVSTNLANCLMSADPRRAVPLAEAALAMQLRLADGQPTEDVLLAQHILACCLDEAGRPRDALPNHEAALAMDRELRGKVDDLERATLLHAFAGCLRELERFEDALAHQQTVLQIRRRESDGEPDLEVVHSLMHVGECLDSMGRLTDGLRAHEEALAMCRQLDGVEAAAALCDCLNNVGTSQDELGHPDLARAALEEGLRRSRELPLPLRRDTEATCLDNLAKACSHTGQLELALEHAARGLELSRQRGVDHPAIAYSLINVALFELDLGRDDAALANVQEALEMAQRLFPEQDHSLIADCLMRKALALEAAGRPLEAIDSCERALALLVRLFRDDHPSVALCLNDLARHLVDHGRIGEGLAYQEESLAMLQRLFRADHPEIVNLMHNVAVSLSKLGQEPEALQRHREAHAMALRLARGGDPRCLATSIVRTFDTSGPESLEQIRLALGILEQIHGGKDHRDLARALAIAGDLEDEAGLSEQAERSFVRSHAMWKRLHGGADHEDLVASLVTRALRLASSDHRTEGTTKVREALAMSLRLHPSGDHPLNLQCHAVLAFMLGATGKNDAEAIQEGRKALAVVDGLRNGLHAGQESRQAYFDALKRWSIHELLQMLLVRAGQVDAAFAIAEHARSGTLQDALAQGGFDELEAARSRAEQNGDRPRAAALGELATAQLRAIQDQERLTLRSAALARLPESPEARASQQQVERESAELAARRRRLQDERIGLLGSESGSFATFGVPEVRAVLGRGEVLLEYVLHDQFGRVYLVDAEGVTTFALPAASEIATAIVTASRGFGRIEQPARGIEPEAPTDADAAPLQRLFTALVPPGLWERLRKADRVFLAAHQQLHGVPFEALVTSLTSVGPTHWIDSGPAVAYVASGSTLVWLRRRAAERPATPLRSAVVVGNPATGRLASPWPTHGAFVTAVAADSPAARAGVRAGDVLVAVGGNAVQSDQDLDAALSAPRTGASTTPIEVQGWRAGESLRFSFESGSSGLELAPGGGRSAVLALQGKGCGALTREQDLTLLGALAPLRGADAEAGEIADLWQERGAAFQVFRGPEADEASVREAAAAADCLHFACHGVGVSLGSLGLSMLVLAPPRDPLADDDGLLRATEILQDGRWRVGRWQLVILSACSTNVGAAGRDDAPQALPIGFLLAGARSVVGTLWPVDDAATRELMVDFHRSLLENGGDRLQALVESKRALRKKHPSPRAWAPFVWHGLPN